jgi:paraquat-inducible protein B
MPTPDAPANLAAAEAVIEPRRGPSLVWLVPLVALLLGAWLVFKALSEKGPTITIVFDSAAGIVAGKTRIKYKQVEAGLVERVELSDDLQRVIVTATLAKELEPYLTEETRFWTVQAEVRAGRVTGLATLLSGVYIGMDPGQKGKSKRHFRGLSNKPIVTGEANGRKFVLRADSLGSLSVGAPVYYRQIEAGRVAGYELDEDGEGITVDVFLQDPFDDLVHEDTRFWNASGITASLTADGFELHSESLSSLLVGGIAFFNPENLEPHRPVDEGHAFRLFKNRELAAEPDYRRQQRHLLYFAGSVRGLARGAPVEFRGIRLGQVLDLKLERDSESLEFQIPVLIELEPDRISAEGAGQVLDHDQRIAVLRDLVKRGLRAQLKTGNLLTGQLYVELDFFPDAEPAALGEDDEYPVIPTVPGALDELRGSVMRALARLQEIPLEDIGNELLTTIRGARELTNSAELRQAITALNRTLQESSSLAGQLNDTALPKIQASLDQIGLTMTSIEANYTGKDSRIYSDLGRLLDELTRASRSLRNLADYLERHPEALVSGKRGVK